MLELLSSSAAAPGLATGVTLTVFLAGFRHGFDLDHIAAISDITSSQASARRSFALATLYAAGHSLVVLALGGMAVAAGASIPPSLDVVMGRVIGLTLVALGVYVVYSLIRFGRAARVPSRWMAVVAAVRRGAACFRRTQMTSVEHEHTHEHDKRHPHVYDDPATSRSIGATEARSAVATREKTHSHRHIHSTKAVTDPFAEYGRLASFGVGMIHGVGAETPTQILLLTTAAGLAGSTAGLILLLAFVAGLFSGNSLLAIAMSVGFAQGKRAPVVYSFLAGITAVLSLYTGTLYSLGRADLLPAFLGG